MVIDLVSALEPGTLDRLAATVQANGTRVPYGLLKSHGPRWERMSKTLGDLLVEVLAKETANAPVLLITLANMREPTRFEDACAPA